MVVIDTSSWIEMLRTGGRAEIRERVNAHLRAGEACIVPMVRLELWNGARGDREKKALRDLESTLPELEMTAEVWNEAFELARRARSAGLTAPAADILITACARHHGASVDAVDTHFVELGNLLDRK
jgi:predicted nucleic acid-binding protein